ncbi:MAG TPA: sugar transferase [Verrucomicrobiae bacterium]|nr:sugar transferase [Verrucomicrobiae bacterium]
MSCSKRLIQLEPCLADDRVQIPVWKRVLDLVCILAALPFLVPVMLIIAAIIKVGSPGPVLFRQQRVGARGRLFTCLKFRTMTTNADTAIHEVYCQRLIDSDLPMVKIDARGDRRLIPIGRPLRACGLDELPQIINVLRGEMSLVGPRPCLPCEYEKHLPGQKERFNTLPGLTGLWQVSGKNTTTFNEMIRLDLQYNQEKSFWLDMKIMIRTIPALIVQVRQMRSGWNVQSPGNHELTVGARVRPLPKPVALAGAGGGPPLSAGNSMG